MVPNGTVIVTGSNGLVGYTVVEEFLKHGFEVYGIDNNMRATYLGVEPYEPHPDIITYDVDIMDDLRQIFIDVKPDLVVHCAAQPSHEGGWMFLNHDVNVNGTRNVLDEARIAGAIFIYISTSRVYVDNLPYDVPVDENAPIDQSRRGLFGASKLMGDIMVQAFGHAYNMPTVCFRISCITGSRHRGARGHGMLAYIAKCAADGTVYEIEGSGMQVRDQLHAEDVARACMAFALSPKVGAVYNLGGGIENAITVKDAVKYFGAAAKFVEPRYSDHKWMVMDYSKFNRDYGWQPTWTLEEILEELSNGG